MSAAGQRPWPRVLGELRARLLRRSPYRTARAPHMRAMTSVDALLAAFVIASLPALMVGLWNTGFQAFEAMEAAGVEVLTGWRGDLLSAVGVHRASAEPIACLLLGLSFFLPLVLVALAVCVFWELVFATLRRRTVDPGWLMTGWLFVLLLPATLPIGLAALGVTFAVVLGKHIFGGTGRYIASPPLLGVLFLYVSYPGFFEAPGALVPVPAGSAPATWALLAEGGMEAAAQQGITWAQVFLGQEVATLGTGSSLACLIGAAFLIRTGAASWRTLLGALGGLILTTLILNAAAGEDPAWQLPWYWQLAVGNFAFAIAFLATDPTTSALTPGGRWIHGALIGVLTVLMRLVNPSHPEGVLFAILVASLFTPAVDYAVLRVHTARMRWAGGPTP